MLKAIITVGISASGKTTFAQKLVEEGWVDINRDWIRFNIIHPGSNWSAYRFKKHEENQVTEIQKQMVMEAFAKEQNVIISDTNLNPSVREMWEGFLSELGYEVEVKPFPVFLEEAWKRDSLRANGVGQNVIYSQYEKWLDFVGRKTYTPKQELPKAVIFDIDGTIAQMEGRSPFEWDKVNTDSPRELIISMACGYRNSGYKIIVVSGRDGICKGLSEEWMRDVGMPYNEFFIRSEGDTRKDTIIKEEIFWKDIAPSYNIVAVVDDRPCVVRMWHELKIPNVICVGNPWKEF